MKRNDRMGRRARRGATIVESAMVLALLLLFLFGIFEYCRFLLVSQLFANAARDGVRYGCANVDKNSTFDSVDQAGLKNIREYVRIECKSADKWVSSFNVSVYPCDAAKLLLDPPVIAPKTSYTSWNQASFTERIAVEITGTYTPVLPVVWIPNGGGAGLRVSFYGSGNTVPIRITAVSGSEG